VKSVVASLDGVFNESGFVDDVYVTGAAWSDKVGFMEYVQGLGKSIYVTSQGATTNAPATQAETEYAVGSYLMGKEHAATVFVSGHNGWGGGDVQPTAAYQPLGTPCGSAFEVPGGAWVRDFQLGQSIVNPGSSNVTVGLDPNVVFGELMGGTQSATVTLAPAMGKVLFSSENRCALPNGARCSQNDQCTAGTCYRAHCGERPGSPCTTSRQCATDVCEGGLCCTTPPVCGAGKTRCDCGDCAFSCFPSGLGGQQQCVAFCRREHATASRIGSASCGSVACSFSRALSK
jgi:hypothetical protein